MKVSPYKLAQMCDVKHPQMVYNYIKQGLIRATKNELGKWEVDLDEPSVVKFVTKRTSK